MRLCGWLTGKGSLLGRNERGSGLGVVAVPSCDNEYQDVRRVQYEGGALFVPVCVKCGRFVKADKSIKVSEGAGLKDAPNATCKKCGRTQMLFEGFY